MKITDLNIHGFGVWSGLKLDELSDGLTVLHGPNEAGKTTLMQFIRGVLYGFATARRRRYLPPVGGGRGGGGIQVEGAGGRFRIERFDESAVDAAELESLGIVDSDGVRHNEHLLETLLGGVDEATFSNVFAFGLSELQRLDTLSDTEAAELLYRISAGLDRVSLVEVLSELDRSRRRILAPAGERSQISRLIEQRRKLVAEIEPLNRLTRQYADLSHRREQCEQRVAEMDQQIAELSDRLHLVEAALAVRPSWHQHRELSHQISSLPTVVGLPPAALRRMNELTTAAERRREQLQQLKRKHRKLLKQKSQLGEDSPLGRHVMRIEAMLEQRPWVADEEKQIDRLQREIRELEARLDSERSLAGSSPEHAGNVARVPQPRRLRRLKAAARDVEAAKQRLADAEKQLERMQAKLSGLNSRIGETLHDDGQHDLTTALQVAGQQVSDLRRRVQIDERIDQLVAQQRQLGEQGQDLVDHQLLPGWVLSVLGAMFALGAVMILLGLVLPVSILGSAGWALTGLGALGLLGGTAAKFLLEYTASRRLDSSHKQLDVVRDQLQQAREERHALDQQLPPGAGPLLTRLSAAEKRLAALEEALPADSDRQTVRQELDGMADQRDAAREALKQAQSRWKSSLTDEGLPEDLSPRAVRRLARQRVEVDELTSQLEVRRQELAARRRSLESIALRVLELAEQAGIQVDGDRTTAHLDELARRLREYQSAAQRREALRLRLRKIRRRHATLRRQRARLARRRRALLRQAGVEDENEFRARATEQARWEQLARRRDVLAGEVASSLAGHATEEALGELLDESDDEQLEQQKQGLSTRLEQLRQRQRRLIEDRGRLGHELKTLAEDRRVGRKYLELDQIDQRLADALRRWQVLSITHRIATSIRETYETKRQPDTLKKASAYIERLTGGRYRRVWTPLRGDLLRVDDDAGQPLAVDVLSRGAREQLFLALRLALAESYATRGIQLPLVFDDLLVNFDTQRAKAAASVLRDFASAGHQVLVFTCHEHLVKLFRSLRVNVRELPRSGDRESPPVVVKRTTTSKKKSNKPSPAAAEKPRSVKPPKAKPSVVIEEPVAKTPSVVVVRSPQERPAVFDAMRPIIIEEPDVTFSETEHVAENSTLKFPAETESFDEEDSLEIELVDGELTHWPWSDHGAEEFRGEFNERVLVSSSHLDTSTRPRSSVDRNQGNRRVENNTAQGYESGSAAAMDRGAAEIVSIVVDEQHEKPIVVRHDVPPNGHSESEEIVDDVSPVILEDGASETHVEIHETTPSNAAAREDDEIDEAVDLSEEASDDESVDDVEAFDDEDSEADSHEEDAEVDEYEEDSEENDEIEDEGEDDEYENVEYEEDEYEEDEYEDDEAEDFVEDEEDEFEEEDGAEAA